MALKLTVLGSNSALPTTKRFASAHVLNSHERFFLIDCSEGTQIRLRQYRIKFSRINHIFISHLHGDHYFGLFGLLSTFSLLGRRQALNIYADIKLQKILETVLNFDEIAYKIIVNPLNFKEPEMIFDSKTLTVTSFPLRHRIPTCGFLFKEKEKLPNIKTSAVEKYNLSVQEIVAIKNGSNLTLKSGEVILHEDLTKAPAKPQSYAYCSDTKYFPRIAEIIKDVDLLYHETTFTAKDEKLAKSTGHSTAEQAAKIALTANAGKLIIGHFSSRYLNNGGLEAEAKKIFPNTQALHDGDTFDISEIQKQKTTLSD